MQVIYKDEDEGRSSREANIVDIFICAREISRCIEGEYLREFGSRIIRI